MLAECIKELAKASTEIRVLCRSAVLKHTLTDGSLWLLHKNISISRHRKWCPLYSTNFISFAQKYQHGVVGPA